MEPTLKEDMLKLTKDEIASRYVTAISTIESKDNEISTHKTRIATLNDELKLTKQQLEASSKVNQKHVNELQACVVLQGQFNELAADRQELLLTIGELLDITESHFKNMSSSINTAYNSFNVLRVRAERKWLPPKEEDGEK